LKSTPSFLGGNAERKSLNFSVMLGIL